MADNNDILKQIADNLSAQTQLMAALAGKEGLHTKAPANWQTATPLHGVGGIFATPGLERDVITAHVRPYGIASILPHLPSTSEDPRFATLTGFTAAAGSEPTHACENAPAGYMKGCNLTARFGLVRRDTQTIEMDKVMLRVNRGDFTDLVLRGRVLGLSGLEPSGLDEDKILNIITMSEMVTAAVGIERLLNVQTWQGNPSVVNQFHGLDLQIATGQVDADTNTACPALDSDVKNYNYGTLGSNIVTYLSQLEWFLRYNAMTMGLEPVEWVIAMRPDLWFELTSVWPCAYNTTRCEGVLGANAEVTVMGNEMVAERDAMRNGHYIDINGRRYRVIEDTGIFEHNSTNNANLIPGEFASSIYMVPLTITGGFPSTYFEYIDYRQAQANISLLRGLEEFFWTDSGKYSWAIEQTKWCFKLSLKNESRIILRAPQLAGRIDRVKYSPLQHLRDSDPASSYFADGGVSTRAANPFYAVWSGR